MTNKTANEYMENEIRCVQRAGKGICTRECAECELVKEDTPLIEAYGMAILALEKQIPKKIKPMHYKLLLDSGWRFACPSCGCAVGENVNDTAEVTQQDDYCATCGQRLDWSC